MKFTAKKIDLSCVHEDIAEGTNMMFYGLPVSRIFWPQGPQLHLENECKWDSLGVNFRTVGRTTERGGVYLGSGLSLVWATIAQGLEVSGSGHDRLFRS